MGYTTEFKGQFNVVPVLTEEHKASLIAFTEHRHSNPIDGYCKWTPNDEGTAIEWDGGEKFYDYIPWIEYLIEKFLTPWGYLVNGTVLWQGEDITDRGKITISNNEVSSYEESEVISIPGIPIELAEYIAIEIGGDREEILQAIYAFIKDKE